MPAGPATDTQSPRTPAEPVLPSVAFQYAPSHDGVQSNILILLHGLGDCSAPFFRLGTSLRLPQTAILALSAPLRVPYLDATNLQWWPSFDMASGGLLDRPDPRHAVEMLLKTLTQLTEQGWPPKSIHLFGFAQGGSLALQVLLSLPITLRLGSVVSVCGGLLSMPAPGSSAKDAVPVLLLQRQSDLDMAATATVFGKAARLAKMTAIADQPQAMPRNRQEWEPVMRFWSEHLRSRPRFSDGDDIVESHTRCSCRRSVAPRSTYHPPTFLDMDPTSSITPTTRHTYEYPGTIGVEESGLGTHASKSAVERAVENLGHGPDGQLLDVDSK